MPEQMIRLIKVLVCLISEIVCSGFCFLETHGAVCASPGCVKHDDDNAEQGEIVKIL